MKRTLAWPLLVTICLISFTGCLTNTAETGSEGTKPVIANLSDLSSLGTSFSFPTQSTPQTLFDDKNVTVNAVSLELKDPATDPGSASEKDLRPYIGLNVTIENKSAELIKFIPYSIAINGITIDGLSSKENPNQSDTEKYLAEVEKKSISVNAGETRDACVRLADINTLSLAGIDSIATLEAATGVLFTKSEMVTGCQPLSVNNIGEGNQYTPPAPDRDGTILYNDHGIKIICLGMDRKGAYSSGGPGITLFVENLHDAPIRIDIKNETAMINNISVPPLPEESLADWQIDTIQPGTSGYTCLRINESVLSNLGLLSTANIKTLECTFIISKAYEEQTIAETPDMTLNFR